MRIARIALFTWLPRRKMRMRTIHDQVPRLFKKISIIHVNANRTGSAKTCYLRYLDEHAKVREFAMDETNAEALADLMHFSCRLAVD